VPVIVSYLVGLLKVFLLFFFVHCSKALVGLDLLIIDVSRSHSEALQSVRLPWTRDRPITETSTWQHNTLKRQTSVLPAGFESAIPASEWLQIHALDGAATEIAFFSNILMILMIWHHLLTNCYAPPAARYWCTVFCHSASWDRCEETSRPSGLRLCFRSVLQIRPTACRVLRKVVVDIPL